MTRRLPRAARVVAIAIAMNVAAAGCSSTPSTPDGGTDAQATLDAGWRDAASRDAGSLDVDASRDAGSDAEPDTGTQLHYPMRCADESIPGFAAVADGRFRPCNCFDGTPLRPVPTVYDEGLRSVPFDCSWPEGMLYRRWSSTSGPIAILETTCEHVNDAVQPGGFVASPVEEQFFAYVDRLPDGVAADRLCVPTECVFDAPGEPARCSDDCGVLSDGATAYVTTYRVDRSACPP